MSQQFEISSAAARLVEVLRARPGAVPENIVLLESGLDAAICAEQVPLLRGLGYDLLRLPNGSYQLLGETDRLLPNELARHRTTRWLGRDLRCFDEVDSTNAVAAALARTGAPAGLTVIADSQTHGRGRLGRSWISPPRRNLYLSVVLRPELPDAELSRLSLVAGVATCEAIGGWHSAEIKWPNDVLIGGRKVAGILMEAEGSGSGRFVVLGIGVNLNMQLDEFPPELAPKAGSLAAATGVRIDRARFAACLMFQLERWYDSMLKEGFAGVAAAWQARSGMTGRKVTVDGPGGQVRGEVIGLDRDGALRLRLDGGGEESVLAGDVTLVGGYERG